MRCKVSGPCGTLVEFLDRDVAVPHVVAVVLQADVKKNMFALLEKPGYEAETKAIRERLK